MIRRDYILRMIEEFFQALSRIQKLRKDRRLEEATAELDQEFVRLLKSGAGEVMKLSETELLARIVQGEPTQVVHDKTLLLTTLLKEAGDLAIVAGRSEEGTAYYLSGLRLLLQVSRGETFDFPQYVPTIETFVTALADLPLTLETQARLMQHYESAGEFAKAEDLLFRMIETEGRSPGLVEFGLAFYRRLQAQSDAALEAGQLPRSELEAGMAELRGTAVESES
jgi:hypothetical protein